MRFVRHDVLACHVLGAGTADAAAQKADLFKDEGKIRELARRGEAWGTPEDRQLLDYAREAGDGPDFSALNVR